MKAYVDVDRYAVSCIPQGYEARRYLTLYVQRGKNDQWYVTDNMNPRRCLSADGVWYYASDFNGAVNEGEDDLGTWDDYLRLCFFDHGEAIEVAKFWAAEMSVNRTTVADVLKDIENGEALKDE